MTICDVCPLKGMKMEGWQEDEASRLANFNRSEEEHTLDGTYNRFVDGFFVESIDESRNLHGDMRYAAFDCGRKQAHKECNNTR